MSKFKQQEKLLEVLQNDNDADWEEFYEANREYTLKFLQKNFGFFPDVGTEIYHETLVIFHQKVINRDLLPPLQSTLRTFFTGIAINLSKRHLKNSSKNQQTLYENNEAIQPNIDLILEQEENSKLLKDILKNIGEPCQQVLQWYYIDDIPLETIAERLQILPGTVRKRKFDCIKKVKKLFKR